MTDNRCIICWEIIPEGRQLCPNCEKRMMANAGIPERREEPRKERYFMKVNWKVRFKNKVWLAMFISLIVSFIFGLIRAFDIVPEITENEVMRIVNDVLTFLGLVGVIVDPTTEGLDDSQRAMNYVEPWHDEDLELEDLEEGDL